MSGVAVHYYWDFVIPASVLTTMHNLFPDRFLFASEASEGLLLLIVNDVYLRVKECLHFTRYLER